MSNWDEDDDATAPPRTTTRMHAASPRELGIALHRVNFADAVPRAGIRSFPGGVPRRPHAESRRAVQSRDQIRPVRWTMRSGSARSCSPPATTRGWLRPRTDRRSIRRAIAAKDQTYFLHAVARARFAQRAVPARELEKQQVRERRRRAGLPVHDKPDSTGICFIGERPFADFLGRYLPGYARADRIARRRAARTAPRPAVLHARPARRAGDRRRARLRAGAVVRRAQGRARATR